MIKTKILPNGARLIIAPTKNGKTVTVLALVGVGLKYENKKNNGISHFLEHMYFKGTKKRPNPKSVAETIDKIGGVYNAFTGDEYTGYYAKVASPHFEKGLDWVSDIFLNSKIPDREMTKEKGVIIEEINMIKDHPMRYINTIWTNLLYGDQPAGWDIAGTKETVTSLGRKDLVSYMRNSYVASNTVICISGNISNYDVENLVSKYFANISKKKSIGKELVIENQKDPQMAIERRKTDQAHICLGVRAYSMFHPQRYTLSIISTILGKMMSSRLFVKIREEMGLAYYINTDYDSSTDTGYLVTQVGVDNKKAVAAVTEILKEYKRISSKRVPQDELNKAKENIKGKLAISLESTDAKAYFYGINYLLKNEAPTIEEMFKEIDSVTADDVLSVSKDIFKSEKLNLAIIGSVNKNEFKNILKI
ncbi:MAG: pitrilysin family protein [Candidatus Pacebacteria bacterium]|nr:pitrilysin family protein [Candidatus Paceibacterota bacterium]